MVERFDDVAAVQPLFVEDNHTWNGGSILVARDSGDALTP
jgi:hypothetical protein